MTLKTSTSRSLAVAVVASGATFLLTGNAVAREPEPELEKIHRSIEARYEDVRHIDADGLAALDDDALVIFDVREEKEFSVSHIDNAIQIDPGISATDFRAQYGNLLAGKTAVFYCSVGRRSSALAARVGDVLPEAGAVAAYNLEGGLFRWRNEERPLMSRRKTPTRQVHPYNVFWGRLIDDRTAISYKPEPAAQENGPDKD